MEPLENTLELVERSRAGEARAQNVLVARYLPILTRWAHGRLPHSARDLSETSDLVQVALLRAFQNLSAFNVQGPGAFFGYLRQIMSNLLRDELRRVGRRPLMAELDENLEQSGASPLRNTITLETLEAYERALAKLSPEQRELITMRVELGLDLPEIARLTHSPSSNAARMRVARALAELAQYMAAYQRVDVGVTLAQDAAEALTAHKVR
jgi:RNA polymerase sigma factor (sigma-70 family)